MEINYKSSLFKCNIVLLLLTIVLLAPGYKTTPTSHSNRGKEVKNILVFCFPGGKSHTFVFRELFNHAKLRLSKEQPNTELKFHIVVHNFDKTLWQSTEHEIFGYGDIKSYEEQFSKAMDNAKDDPVLGYNQFNKAMIHLYHDFLKDGLISTLRGINFDLIITDVSNFLSIFLKKELNIPRQIYMNPTCLYVWFNEVFEYNASYHPLIGTTFTDQMTFKQRFINQLFLFGTRFSYLYFQSVQGAVFKQYGYNYDINPFQKDALYLNQCVDGLHYSLSLPPNIISIGAVLPKPRKTITDGSLESFLNKYESNVYVSQGTITKALRLEVLKELFEKFPHVGFVLSLKSDFHKEWREKPVPENVLLREWVPQNDLLGDDRVLAFITHGGLNSILESVYHAKPMIVIGTSIDQVNGAVTVEYRQLGVGITRDKDITLNKMTHSLEEVLNNPKYKTNCQQASLFVREKDGKEVFYYWLNYTLAHGYEHLLVPSYMEYSVIQLYNIDVFAVWLGIFFLIYKLIKMVFIKIWRRIKSYFGFGKCTEKKDN